MIHCPRSWTFIGLREVKDRYPRPLVRRVMYHPRFVPKSVDSPVWKTPVKEWERDLATLERQFSEFSMASFRSLGSSSDFSRQVATPSLQVLSDSLSQVRLAWEQVSTSVTKAEIEAVLQSWQQQQQSGPSSPSSPS